MIILAMLVVALIGLCLINIGVEIYYDTGDKEYNKTYQTIITVTMSLIAIIMFIIAMIGIADLFSI